MKNILCLYIIKIFINSFKQVVYWPPLFELSELKDAPLFETSLKAILHNMKLSMRLGY